MEHIKTDFHEVQFKKHQDVTIDIPNPKQRPRGPPASAEKERRVPEEANKMAGKGRRDRPPSPPSKFKKPQPRDREQGAPGKSSFESGSRGGGEEVKPQAAPEAPASFAPRFAPRFGGKSTAKRAEDERAEREQRERNEQRERQEQREKQRRAERGARQRPMNWTILG